MTTYSGTLKGNESSSQYVEKLIGEMLIIWRGFSLLQNNNNLELFTFVFFFITVLTVSTALKKYIC